MRMGHLSRNNFLDTVEWVTLCSGIWCAQRGENFDNARLGHLFSLVTGARSVEKILLLQPWRAQRKEKFCNARLGYPFSLVSAARSAEKILLLHPWSFCKKHKGRTTL